MPNKLTESIQDLGVLVESKGGKKTYYLEGIIMQAEVVNGNGRKYQKWEMEREIEKYNREKVATRQAIGELDHPSTSTMNLSKMCLIYEEPLRMEGNNVIGKCRILDTIWGDIVKCAIDEGIPFGVSSRGRGELSMKDDYMLVNNFELIVASDIVENPSAPDARPTAFTEMITEALNSSDDLKLLEEVQKNTQFDQKSKLDEAIIKTYNNIINKIKNK